MPVSTVSLDSLSSPPSISPSPSPTSLTEPTNLNEIATAALDLGSDSDLSELTEDEQDQDTPPLQSNIPDDKPQSQSRPSRRGRRKRSSIVPAPMWGWAETKTPAEEEEEEEVEEEEEEEEEEPTAGRPAVMEEEEEEEEESTSRSEPRRARPRLTQRRTFNSNHKPIRTGAVESESEDNNAAAGPSKKPASDDELADIRAKHVYQKSLNSRHTKSSLNMKSTRKSPPKSESDNDNHDRPTTTLSNRKPSTRGRPPRRVGRPSRKAAQLESPPADMPSEEKETDPLAVAPKEEQIKVAVSSAAPRPYEWEDWEPSDFSTPTPEYSPPPIPAPVASDATMNQDPPPPAPLLPSVTDTSISAMAESVNPPAGVVVPAVVTAASPHPTKDNEPTEKEDVRDMEMEVEVDPATNVQDPLPAKVDVKAIVDSTAADVVVPEPIAQVEVIEERLPSPEREQEPVQPEPENEPEQEPEQDHSMEVVSDPSPEDIEMEMETETDLQPAHRAEALDVLASIELKFALLRERVYVEKMESLAWEESLVLAGTHPELIHLHLELSKRKDKRLELATRKRAYEAGDETSNIIGNARKRRDADETSVWGWWKHERNELQTDMISETNRKRRRLERERRAVERPQAARRIPEFSSDVSLPPPPTIRQIIKAFPFGSTHDTNRTRRGKGKAKPQKLVFPELGTLTAADIQHDLSVILHNPRRPTAIYEGTMNAHRMGGNHMNVDTHNEMGLGMPPSFGGSGSRISQSQSLGPPPPFQHHQSTAPALNGHGQFPGSSSGRIHHQNSYYNHGHAQSQLPFGVVDADMSGPGPSQAHQPHHQYYGSQGGPGYSGNGTSSRRSISPVTVGVSGKQNGNGTWMGIGMGFPGPMMEDRRSDIGMSMGMGGMTEDEERANRARRNNSNMKMKEREMERDREREREQLEIDRERERERDRFLMQQQQALQQQQHRHSQAQHQHVHVPQGQPAHHHVVPHHHHHHHHHVVHHHHAQQPQSGPGGPPPAPNGSGPPMSPSRAREFDRSAAPTPTHPTELINLSATKLLVPHWKGDGPSSDYRDRNPTSHIGRPSSGPSIAPDDRERPLATPYVMTSTHTMPTSIPPPSSNGASPRGAWNPPEENGSFRVPPPSVGTPAGYLGPLESQGIHNSPGPHRFSGPMGRGPPQSVPGAQSLTRQNSTGVSPPHPRSIPPPPSPKASSSSLPYPGPIRSPTRFGPPPPPRSPTNVNLKIPRPGSPVLGSKMMGTAQQQPTNSVYSPPRLGGPGRASTPTGLGPVDIKSGNTTMNSSGPTATAYTVGSKPSAVASPFPSLASSHPNLPPPLSRPPPNLSGPSDRRPSSPHHLPPVPPAQKMTVDGH